MSEMCKYRRIAACHQCVQCMPLIIRENLQLDLQVPAAFGGIIEGLILLTVLAGGLFTHYRLVRGKK